MDKHSLCWDCKRSTEKSCDWAREFEPVQGWTAKPERVKCGDGKGCRYTASYHVIKCPMFVRDAYDGGMYRLNQANKYREILARREKEGRIMDGKQAVRDGAAGS